MKLRHTINADLKLYNANTRGKSVGDCVKRALCMGFSMDYDEVSRELNKIKREKHQSAYNVSPVFNEFVKRRGTAFYKDDVISPETGVVLGTLDKDTTVREFSETYSEGTYILEVGKPGGKFSTHLCCVVDGDVYDSWNSTEWKIYEVCVVSEHTSPIYELEVDDVINDMQGDIDYYLERLFNRLKIDYATYSTSYDRSFGRDNRYTGVYYVFMKFTQPIPTSSKYHRSKSWGHEIVFKLNPRFDADKNREILFKKFKQKVYDWIYNIVRDIKDAREAEQTDFSNYSGWGFSNETKKFIMHLPQWVRNRVTDVEFGDGEYTDKYKVYFQAFDDDPYLKERGDEVCAVGDTLTDLKSNIESYKERWSRFYYDY